MIALLSTVAFGGTYVVTVVKDDYELKYDAKLAKTALKARKIELSLDTGSGPQAVFPKPASGAPSWKSWPEPVNRMVEMAIDLKLADNSEVDVFLPDANGDLHAMTLWVNGPNEWVIGVGGVRAELPESDVATLEKAPSVRSIANEKKEWEPATVASVVTALAMLSDEERARMGELDLMRKFVKDADRKRGALYSDEHGVGRLEIYDRAGWGKLRYVGTLSEPHDGAVFTILHELGHAVAAHDRRMKRAELVAGMKELDAKLKELRIATAGKSLADDDPQMVEIAALDTQREGLVKEHDAFDEATAPAATAFREKFGETAAPTKRGLESANEGFADAFALHHLDPDALERLIPGANAWFDSGEHLK